MGSPSVLSNSTGKGASLKLGGGKWWDGKELFLYSGCHENRPTQAFPKCPHKRLRTNLIGRLSDWVARGIHYFLYAGGVGFQGTGKAILSFAAKKCLCLAGVSRPKGRERRFTGLIRRARHERLGLRPCGRVLFMWGRLRSRRRVGNPKVAPVNNRRAACKANATRFFHCRQCCGSCGADPLVCAGRLRPASGTNGVSVLQGASRPTGAAAGVQGGRPTIYAGAQHRKN